jgi:hypothetical protein
LQGICDGDRNFWNIYIVAPGGTHDATHLRQSTFYKSLVRKEILQEHILRIEGEELKPYIVGDSAYPLHTQVQKPFTAKRTGSDDQNTYDKCLRGGHVKIENTFGILKNRWRILKNLNVDVKHAALIITTRCVLHNFCCMNHDICRSGISGIQDPHTNLNVNRGVPIRITSERALSRKGQKVKK